METIKVFGLVFAFALVYGFISDDDYQKLFAKDNSVRYNCDMLMGGWHPDVPPKVIEECRNLKRKY